VAQKRQRKRPTIADLPLLYHRAITDLHGA
jgi:hypothetical protein